MYVVVLKYFCVKAKIFDFEKLKEKYFFSFYFCQTVDRPNKINVSQIDFVQCRKKVKS